MKQIKIAKVDPAAKLPTRKFPCDAGLDLYSLESVEILQNTAASVRTGISVDIPRGYVGLVLSKSRNNYILGGGVVDAGYQGEIKVKINNPSTVSITVPAGAGIAQLLIMPVETPEVLEVPLQELYSEKSERGETGGIHFA